jgi:hypothetical protein
VRSPEDRYASGSLRLVVKRASVFEDSFNKLRSKTPAEMRGKLSVAFVGEEGIDAGGVSREWYQVRHCCRPGRTLMRGPQRQALAGLVGGVVAVVHWVLEVVL